MAVDISLLDYKIIPLRLRLEEEKPVLKTDHTSIWNGPMVKST